MEHFRFDRGRVMNFNDAVFSIAMTILVLDIKVPEVELLREEGFGGAMAYQTASIIGFFVSFMVIAMYWKGHLRNMSFASEIDGKLLWYNILNLLFIVALPYTTALYVKYFTYGPTFQVYALNIAVIGIMNILMLRYLYKSDVKNPEFTIYHRNWFVALGVNVALVWIAAAILADYSLYGSRFLFLMIFINDYFIKKYYLKKLKKHQAPILSNEEE